MSANCEVWVHDTRVEGVVLDAPGRHVLRVDRSTPVMSIATSVQAVVQRAGGATALWLVFHAPYTGQSRSQAEGGWEDALFGGMSELGKDGVTSRNVAEFGASLRGLFSDSIRVLAAGPRVGTAWRSVGASRFIRRRWSSRLRTRKSTRSITWRAEPSTSDLGRGESSNSSPAARRRRGSSEAPRVAPSHRFARCLLSTPGSSRTGREQGRRRRRETRVPRLEGEDELHLHRVQRLGVERPGRDVSAHRSGTQDPHSHRVALYAEFSGGNLASGDYAIG
jgi:hypothetical protein